MATQNNKPVISLWLCLLLLAIGSGLMLFIDAHLDPAERAFGICHGTTLDTQHARIYKFDNIDAPSTEKLRAGFPNHDLLVDNRSELGVMRLLFLGFLAFTVCLNLRFFWLYVRDEVTKTYKAGLGRKALSLLPIAIGGLLFHNQFDPVWTSGFYCLLLSRLSIKSAHSKVKIKSFARTLRWLRFVGLAWFSQVALITFRTDPNGEGLGMFSLVFLAAFLPTLKPRAERVSGDKGRLQKEIGAWSGSRYWMLTIGIATAILQQAQSFDKFLGGWTNFLWPTLALAATRVVISALGDEHNPGRSKLRSLSRVVACSWFMMGLPVVASIDNWQFGENSLAIWVFGLALFLRYGRPWGSVAKNFKPSLADPKSDPPSTLSETSDQNIPAECAISVGVLSILIVLCTVISPIQLPTSWSVENVDQMITQSLDNQSRTLNVGSHGFQVLKVGDTASYGSEALFVQDTWPELVGVSLLGLAGFLALGLVVLWTNHQWDQGLREDLKGEAFPIVGATFGAYALGGLMGWHWASPTPFVVLYLVFISAPSWLAWIPLRSRVPAQFANELSCAPGEALPHLEEENHFRDALEIEVVAGNEAAKLFDEDSLGGIIRKLTGSPQPQVLDSLEPGQLSIICAARVVGSFTVRVPGELEIVRQNLQSVLRQRSRRVLTFDRVQSWLNFQTDSFPGAARQVRMRRSIGTLQFVLRGLVEKGSMLEEPEVILDVLATADGDENELLEQCVEALALSTND